ncbi:MAG: L,D-transpeptidase family protein [Verrucomicrobiota bacterium]
MTHQILLLSLAAGLLVGCAGSNDPYGRTAYLRGVGDPTAVGAYRQEGPMADSVSYWDGEGYSGAPSVVIDLTRQQALFYKGGRLVGSSLISSGREGYRTPTGNFKIIQKSRDHASNLYGKIVDAYGNVVNPDADSRKDPVPRGGRFVGAPMPYFMRIHGGIGLHAGYIPGYPASHGCIRMPERMARTFFDNVAYGTPVRVIR